MRWSIRALMAPLLGAVALLGSSPAAAAPRASAMLDALESVEASPPAAVMTDRPIYAPGETIWFRTWRSEAAVELRDARGRAVAHGERDPALPEAGALIIPNSAGAGRYRLRVGTLERPILVEETRRPPLRLELRYARSSHRTGEPVTALLHVRGTDGAPLVDRPVVATATVGEGIPLTVDGRTDAEGRLALRFELPGGEGDARLNLRVEGADGQRIGFTRPIPQTPPTPLIDVLPEGGEAVVGLPGRVYLAARRAGGRPASFSGRVLDDADREVAAVRSVIDGRARFDWTPEPQRRYRLVLDGGGEVPLPTPSKSGCALRAVDDFDDRRPTIGLDIRCASERPLIIAAGRDGALLAVENARAGDRRDTRVELKTPRRRGPVTVTLLDPDGTPLAERVVFRHRDRGLDVSVQADRAQAAPGETVTFAVRARDADGAAVEGDLALAVVDEGALAHADDQSPEPVAQMLLSPVVRGHLERAGRYLAPGAQAGEALDLLMGTAGYRRFTWLFAVMGPDGDGDGVPDAYDACPAAPGGMDDGDRDGCRAEPASRRPPPGQPPPWRNREGQSVRPTRETPPDEPQRVVITSSRIEVRERIYFDPGSARIQVVSWPIIDAVAQVMRANPQIRRVAIEGHTDAAGSMAVNQRMSEARAQAVRTALIERGVEPARLEATGYGETRPITLGRSAQEQAYNRRVEFTIRAMDHDAPVPRRVRRFPPPPPPTPARDDFRETVAWVPRLSFTDGVARVAVRLSDASTTFRATVSGTGGGAVGSGEAVVGTRTPLQLEVDAPRRLLAGDRVEVPALVTNHSSAPFEAQVSWSSPHGEGQRGLGRLEPGAQRAFTLPLSAQLGAGGYDAKPLQVTARGGAHSDTLSLGMRAVGRGYPQYAHRSGWLQADQSAAFEFAVPDDAADAEGSVTVRGGVVPSLREAVEAMVREPGGCFEQTTSAHWPNVMALRLFESARRPFDPALVARTRAFVEKGAARLATFQNADGGFAMYVGGASQPWLTAYAVVQLHESDLDPAVLARAIRWLKAHRDPEMGAPRADAVSAWIDWALAIGGEGLGPPPTGEAARDPYVLAVRILALLAAGQRDGARPLGRALIDLADDAGRWTGGRSTVTGSGGPGAVVETSALAVRALAKLKLAPALRAEAIATLQAARLGQAWHTTQATVQALAAILTAKVIDEAPPAGRITVFVNDRRALRVSAAALGGERRTVDLRPHLDGGPVKVRIEQSQGLALSWSVAARWSAETVPPGRAPALGLTTALERATLKAGEATTLTATVTAGEVTVADPLLRIGLPAGLVPDREQLRDWQEAGRVALAELRPGEVVLYLDRLDAGQRVSFPLTVTARRPGRFRGRPSSAYPYYTPDAAWAPPLAVRVK